MEKGKDEMSFPYDESFYCEEYGCQFWEASQARTMQQAGLSAMRSWRVRFTRTQRTLRTAGEGEYKCICEKRNLL